MSWLKLAQAGLHFSKIDPNCSKLAQFSQNLSEYFCKASTGILFWVPNLKIQSWKVSNESNYTTNCMVRGNPNS